MIKVSKFIRPFLSLLSYQQHIKLATSRGFDHHLFLEKGEVYSLP